jgi:hypothetical protein
MNFVQELVTGLHVAVRAARQRGFWGALAGALFTWPVLAALAVPGLLFVTAMGPWPGARTLLALLAMLLGVAIVLRAWCPLLAQVAMGILGMRYEQLPLPSPLRFLGWTAMTAAFLAVVNKVPLLLPLWTLWIAVPFASLLVSAFLVRCMLCVHADGERYRAVLRRTIVRRTLLWVPVSLVPYLVFALLVRPLRGQAWWRGLLGSDAGGVIGAVLAGAVLLAITVLVLVLWAAWSLQALQSLQPQAAARMPAPAPPVVAEPGARRPGAIWVAATAALVLLAVVVAWENKMAVAHHYLRLTDARYQPVHRTNRYAFQHLFGAIIDSACKGDLGFLKKLIGMDLRPSQETLSTALECAVARSDAATVSFLIDSEASTFAAFRNAVATRNLAMVRLMAARGAAADRYEGYSRELGMAASSRDFTLMKILIDGGAVQDGYSDAGRVAVYEYLTASVPADDSAARWEKVVADGVDAGLQLKNKYKKADGVLHFAARKGYLGLVEVLLARGMDPTVPGKDGALPFMRLAAWYPGAGAEPGPGFERALLALTRGVDNINAPAVIVVTGTDGTIIRQESWTLAGAAATNPRVRAVFGERIDSGASPLK